MVCGLCPNLCSIKKGESGVCGVRNNTDGTSLSLPYYGAISSLASDPIEKKPLYHFFPGSRIFSAGFVGCSLRCPFCQNYRISQSTDAAGRSIGPGELVDLAIGEKSFGIAYTYSEPVIHAEYIIDAARTARKKGLKNVLVTNGYVNPGPGKEILEVMDAANIDLKSFNPEFYTEELGGKLEPVLDFIRIAAEKIHIEITTLVIPGKNDSGEEIAQIADFIATLDKRIPLHLSCYYPTYQYIIRATEPEDVFRLADIAGERLDYVYPGNVGLREANTICRGCGALLVRRSGYSVAIPGIKDGRCVRCGEETPIIGI